MQILKSSYNFVYEFENLNITIMKKLFLVLALFALVSTSFVACETPEKDKTENPDDPNNPDNPDNPDPDNPDEPDTLMTPGEHKARLEEIALDFVNSFDVADVEDAADAAYNLAEYLDEGDFPDYYSDMMMDIANGVKSLSTANFVSFATRVAEDFVIDINDPEFNPYAGHSYTFDGQEWVEGKIDNKSIMLVWDNASALISWAGSKTLEYYYEDEEEEMNVVAYVPSTVSFSFTIDGREYIGIDVDMNITDIQTMAPSVEARINGGYVVSASSDANNKGVEYNSSIKKNNKTLFSSAGVVSINDVTDIDNWFYTYYCEYCDEDHTYIDPSEYIGENIKTGQAQVDIMGVLSTTVSGDFKGMYEEIMSLEDDYDWEDSSSDKQYYQDICDLINENVVAAVVYSDTKQKVADVVMQVYEDSYYDEYDVELILLFEDGSKFAFEEYFTENAFRDLIDKIKQIAEDVKDL